MSWFNAKKEDEKLDKLPELPQLPELPEPSLLSPLKKESQTDSLIDLEVDDIPELPEPKIQAMQQKQQFTPIKPQAQALPMQATTQMQKSSFSYDKPILEDIKQKPLQTEPKSVELGYSKTQGYAAPVTKKSEPIFIRLDKFESTVENFEGIKEKINEIEELLMKTREIKAKEEEELGEWEKEIQIIKARLDSIDRNLLNKLD